MGQKTQNIISIRENGKEIKQFTLHNQQGFGRPLVSQAIGIVQAIKTGTTNPDIITKYASWPNGLNEIFNVYLYNKEPEIKYPNEGREDYYDNDNGFSITIIDKTKQGIKVKTEFFLDGEWMNSKEYIDTINAPQYITEERKRWYHDNRYLIDNVLRNFKDTPILENINNYLLEKDYQSLEDLSETDLEDLIADIDLGFYRTSIDYGSESTGGKVYVNDSFTRGDKTYYAEVNLDSDFEYKDWCLNNINDFIEQLKEFEKEADQYFNS